MRYGTVPLELTARSGLATDKDESKGKGKVHPRKDHEGPEGEYRYSSTFSLTSALDWGGCSTSRPVGFTIVKDPVTIVWESEWASGPFWMVAGIRASHRDSIPGPSS